MYQAYFVIQVYQNLSIWSLFKKISKLIERFMIFFAPLNVPITPMNHYVVA